MPGSNSLKTLMFPYEKSQIQSQTPYEEMCTASFETRSVLRYFKAREVLIVECRTDCDLPSGTAKSGMMFFQK